MRQAAAQPDTRVVVVQSLIRKSKCDTTSDSIDLIFNVQIRPAPPDVLRRRHEPVGKIMFEPSIPGNAVSVLKVRVEELPIGRKQWIWTVRKRFVDIRQHGGGQGYVR